MGNQNRQSVFEDGEQGSLPIFSAIDDQTQAGFDNKGYGEVETTTFTTPRKLNSSKNGRPRRFVIERKFTCTSHELTKSLAKIDKVLTYLEHSDFTSRSLDEPHPMQQRKEGNEINKTAKPQRQFELDLYAVSQSHEDNTNDTDTYPTGISKRINQKKLKIVTMVTDEIIELLTRQDNRLAITKLNEDSAIELSKYIRGQLVYQQYALATKNNLSNPELGLIHKLA